MATNTTNYNLIKPNQDDFYDIDDFNQNTEIIDAALKEVNNKADGKISKSLATAAGQFLASTAAGQWAVKTIAEIKTLLGLKGSADKDFNVTGGTASFDTVQSHLSDYTLQIPWGGTTTNNGNVYSLAGPPITALTAGMAVSLKCNADASGAVRLDWFSTGAKSVLKPNGTAVTNWKKDGIYTVRYDGANFRLQGEGGEYGTAGATQVLSGYTVGTENGLIQGTIPIKTPDILNQVNALGTVVGTNSGDSQNCVYLQFTDADKFFQGSRWVRSIQPNLLAHNIVKDKDICGVVGTFSGKGWYKSTGSPSYYGAFMWDNGEIPYAYGLEVSLNLSFTPKTIIIWRNALPSFHTIYSSEFEIMTATGYQAIYTPYYSHIFVMDCTYAYLRSSGFRMPVTENNEQYTFLILG